MRTYSILSMVILAAWCAVAPAQAWAGLVSGPAARTQFEGFRDGPTADTFIDFNSLSPGTQLDTELSGTGVTFSSNIGTSGETPFGPYYVYVSTAFPSAGLTIVGSPCNGCGDDGRVGYQIVFTTPQRRAGLQRIWNSLTVTRFYNESNALLAEYTGSGFVGFIADGLDSSTDWVKRIQIDGLIDPGDMITRQVGYSDDLFFGSAEPPSTFIPALVPGFNLIGNSFDITIDVAATFGNQGAPVVGVTDNIVSIWKWNAVAKRWAFYTPQLSAAANAAFAVSKSYDLITTINPGEGYWVSAVNAGTLPAQTGAGFNWFGADPSILLPANFSRLPAGFNLIAHAANVTPGEFNNDVSVTPPGSGVIPTNNFLTLWAWDAVRDKWYFYSPLIEATDGLEGVKSYADSRFYLHFQDYGKTLGVGVGFWVNSTGGVSYTLSTTISGDGTVEANPAGGTHASGATVTLTATPGAGSTFAGWSGDCTGTGVCTVTMNSNKSVTATFSLIPVTYTLTTSVVGNGTVDANPAGGTHASGTAVTLTATPGAGSTFAGWSGACTGTATTCTVTMNANQSVTATFNGTGPQQGAFWEFFWTVDTTTFAQPSTTTSTTNAGIFRVTLGAPVTIQGIQAFPPVITGQTGTSPDFRPRWTHIAFGTNVIYGSTDGATLRTILDANNSTMTGGGFLLAFNDSETVNVTSGTFTGNYNTLSATRAGHATSSGGCQTVLGVVLCSDTSTTFSEFEYFKAGIGPIGMTRNISYSSSGGGFFTSTQISHIVEIIQTSFAALDGSIVQRPPWEETAPMMTARYNHAAAAYNGRIYVFGGYDASNAALRSVEIFDPQASVNPWSAGAPAPAALAGGYHVARTVGNKIYLIPGSGTLPVGIYDPVLNSWTTGASHGGTFGYDDPSHDGDVMTLDTGGVTGDFIVLATPDGGLSTRLEINLYRPSDDTWWYSSTTNAIQRRWMAATAVGDDLYTIGGYIPADFINPATVTSLTRRYHLETDTWSSNLDSLNVPRHSGKAVTLNGEPVVLGGTSSTSSAIQLNSVEAYDPATNQWRELPSMLRKRQNFAAVVLGGKIYVMGGSSGSARLNNVEVYTP